MSMEYCPKCDRMIDLDYDCEHEHFQKELKGGNNQDGKSKRNV